MNNDDQEIIKTALVYIVLFEPLYAQTNCRMVGEIWPRDDGARGTG